jgi:hypothetical protein
MVTRSTLMWVQRMAWICIYGGLLSIVLGVFLARADMALARLIQGVGSVSVVIGVALIYVRSRLKEAPSP